MAQEKIRLQKIIADCGLASRRKAEEWIAAGDVAVNGETAKLGDRADPAADRITVRGKPLAAAEENVYLMLHKPRGYITTMSDERDRKCVAELIEDVEQRVYPVGRLDKDSEGLLLMTNDGSFANALTHPARHVPKTYRVTVHPAVTDEQLAQMESGMVIDGRKTAPARVRVLTQEKGRVVLEIILYEGRNRQIRNMCEQLGLEVARLKRVAMGCVRLGMLPPGKWRALTPEEVRRLKEEARSQQTGTAPKGKPAARRKGRGT